MKTDQIANESYVLISEQQIPSDYQRGEYSHTIEESHGPRSEDYAKTRASDLIMKGRERVLVCKVILVAERAVTIK